jgi:uncharacterized protein
LSSFSNWRKFKVRTLRNAALSDAANDLAALARGFDPTLIIGIRSGGYHVAELVAKNLPQATLLPITCRRRSTGGKKAFPIIKDIVRRLPQRVTNPLRILEHIVLTQLRPSKPGILLPDAEELAGIKYAMLHHSSNRILIVDDAVDSGTTLAATYKALQDIANPATIIKMAAITVTTHSPSIEPDFSLYRYVLCRFPWSLDFRE